MYKLSKFNIVTEINEKYIIFNSLTCAIIKLNKEYYDAMCNGTLHNDKPTDYLRMHKMGFVCDLDYNEDNEGDKKENVLNELTSMSFIMLTTEQCNFRCEYCYEERRNAKIGNETYDSLLKYLEKQQGLEKVGFSWYGGEPTLESKNILSFLDKAAIVCNKNNILLQSAMITNGYLLTKDLFNNFLDRKINRYQITIDGLGNDHDSRRFLADGKGSFDTIIDNLKEIVKSPREFFITLRCNYDAKTNANDYLDFINEIIKNDKRFILSFHQIANWSTNDTNCTDIPIDSTDMEKYAVSKGMRILWHETYATPFANVCYASYPNVLIINSKSELLKCSIKLDSNTNKVGYISKDGELIFNEKLKLWLNPLNMQKCKVCNVRPLCLSRYCPQRYSETNDCQKGYLEQIHKINRIKYS